MAKNIKSSRSLIMKKKLTLILDGSLFNVRRRTFEDLGLMLEELQEEKMKKSKMNQKGSTSGNLTSLVNSNLYLTANSLMRLNLN